MPHREEYETQRETLERKVKDGHVGQRTANAIGRMCDALDPANTTVPIPDGEKHRAVKTLDMYTRRLRLIAERFDGNLTDTTARKINDEM